MNSRFKFRVWNIKYGIYCDQMTEMVINSNGVCYDNGVSADYFEYNGFIIEQCTGLKDKNGNLIYEGDIVNYCGEINTVVFDVCGFKFKDNEGLCIEPYRADVEIIGNIHEQAEQKDVK